MRNILILITLLVASLAGCASDDADDAPEPVVGPSKEPSYNVTLPDVVTGIESVTQTVLPSGDPLPSGAGIWVHGDYAFGSALGAGFWIADVSDPQAPEVVWNATIDPDDPDNNTITEFARDADVVPHPDGRLTLVLATQSDGMHVWDVTDPHRPEFMSRVDVNPNHNIAVVPGTELVFNSQSGGAGRTNELIDVSQPAAPMVLGSYGTHGCHDITFHGSLGEDRFRAYCAGIDRTEIWDLDGFAANATDFGIGLVSTIGVDSDDPASILDSPVVGNPAFSAYPLRTLHHLAMVNEDASILIIGDEQNGGGSPGGCVAHEGNTGLSSPTGALWFYDLSDETDPQLLNWLGPEAVTGEPDPEADPAYDPLRDVPNCTAHFGTLVPGEDKIVMAWYSAGVLLIDFSGVSQTSPPTILEQIVQPGTNPWDARVQGGYVFTGDIGRGMDVLKLV